MTFAGHEGLRYVGAFLITFGAAWALTPLAGRFAHRHGFLDQPGGHSTHTTATPTLGGLAIAAASILVGVWAGGADGQLVTVLAGAVMLAVVGALDDRRSLSPWLRLGVEAAAAVALWAVGVRAGLLGHTWFDLPLTVVWVMAVVNAFNMIDNHDGIAALVAAMSTLGIAAISAASGYHLVAAFSLAVTAACLGFFVHNKPPATIFLGDAGSMFLGFLVAALALKVDLPEGSWIVRLAVAALLVAVPLFDEALVVIARVREHRPVMLGSTDHSAHRLRALGWSKNRVVVTMGGAQAVCSLIAFGVAEAATDVLAMGALFVLAAAAATLLAMALKTPMPRREAGAIGTVGFAHGK
jgi:UDP-GlcNAc:undecaprenyl-phosphate/decaprenyl-phosphate GlcNAc-1-phosphate transferase